MIGARARPLRVFLSHTADLREHPAGRSFVAAAEAAVIRAGHAVLDMEYFTARDGSVADFCTTTVARADVYVGVVGLRYGAPVPDRPGLSYTELEFDTATQRGLPRLIFMVADVPAGLPAASQPAELAERQQAFRRRLVRDSGLTVAWVRSPVDLELGLLHALAELRWRPETSPVTSFGQLLRGFRRQGGLTQEELAVRAGLSVQAVSLLEREGRRRPHRYTVRALAEALRLDPAEQQLLLQAAASPPGEEEPVAPTTGMADAIALGAAAVLADPPDPTVRDAYGALRSALARGFNKVQVGPVEDRPSSRAKRAALAEDLAAAGADVEPELWRLTVTLVEAVWQREPRVADGLGIDLQELRGGVLKIAKAAPERAARSRFLDNLRWLSELIGRKRTSREEEPVGVAFGELLRRYRESRGLTQEALGARSGLSARAISLLERGHRTPRMHTVRRLADVLRLAASDFDEFRRAAESSGTASASDRQADPEQLLQVGAITSGSVIYGRDVHLSSDHASGPPLTSGEEGSRETAVLVGKLRGVVPEPEVWIRSIQIAWCEAHPRTVQHAIKRRRPRWLVLAGGLDESTRTALLQAARAASPNLRLAVLGPEDDLELCERWMRRGCSVYLAAAASLDRLVRALEMAAEIDVAVTDDCFQAARLRRATHEGAQLTPREHEVLQLVALGRSNAEVAKELGMSVRTVDFHVRNLLDKLDSRSRSQAIVRAIGLGLLTVDS